MNNTGKELWLSVGYKIFAQEGLSGLKVESLARKVSKSKSSFYHHFGDLDLFKIELLNHHVEEAKTLAERAKKCKNVEPEIVNLMVEAKDDVLFNRQLRVHRNIGEFKDCFEKASGLVEDAFLEVWSKDLGLGNQTHLGRIILNLIVENFYLKVTEENLHYDWIANYFAEVKTMVDTMVQSKN